MDKFTATVTISMSEYEHLKNVEQFAGENVSEVKEVLRKIYSFDSYSSRMELQRIQIRAKELLDRSIWKKSPEAK